VGFAVFVAYVLPAHYKFFGIGLCITACTLGLRHAFDADHISAIDNTTRKVMNERHDTDKPRPFSFGYFFFIGGIETLSLIPQDFPASFSQNSGFWGFMFNFNINTAGFVIVGMFIVTWAAAMAIWRFAHIEEKWSARLQGAGGTETPLEPPWAGASE
jgi:high-affinity nickel permease